MKFELTIQKAVSEGIHIALGAAFSEVKGNDIQYNALMLVKLDNGKASLYLDSALLPSKLDDREVLWLDHKAINADSLKPGKKIFFDKVTLNCKTK